MDAGNENKHTGPFTVNGEITIGNLLPGEYQLTEVQAPNGFILDSRPVTFTINSDGTVTYTGGNTKITFVNKSASEDPASFQISNTPGVELPATGGPGTAAYTASGLALMLGAVWMLLRRKRETN